MWRAVDVHFRTLVVIRPRTSLIGGYDTVECGLLEDYGDVLCLVGDHGSREVTDAELRSLQPVGPENKIKACDGFDFSSSEMRTRVTSIFV